MNNREAIKRLKEVKAEYNDNWVDYGGINEALNLAIKALEERPTGEPYMEFARFVAKEVLDDDFKENADFFAEVACRKLVKLGLLKVECGFYKVKNELCETCKKRNSCSDSTKDFSNCITAKCFRYEREAEE